MKVWMAVTLLALVLGLSSAALVTTAAESQQTSSQESRSETVNLPSVSNLEGASNSISINRIEFDTPADSNPPTIARLLGQPAQGQVCADQNSDGQVNIFDVIIDLQIIVGLVTATPEQEALSDVVQDGAINIFDVILTLQHIVGLTTITDCGVGEPSLVTVRRTSPASGEGGVAVTRETVIEFSGPIEPASVTTNSVLARFGGQDLAARRQVSRNGQTVTLFYDEPLPPSARVRITVNGDVLRDGRGRAIDGNGDGQPGGVAVIDFDTLSLTRVPDTDVFGFVYDSYNKNPDGSDIPVAGVTIRVDGFPEANVVTDETGFFQLEDMPAPVFFVHVDGSTASAPPGKVYATVGKAFHSVAGQTRQLFMDGEIFHIYLPTLDAGDIQPLSPIQETEVGFGPAGKAELVKMFPDLDPEVWDRTMVMFPPNSAVDDQGNPATQAAIIPVPSDRLPAPLPPGINHQLDIAVMAQGATNFDVPAPACFPNLPDPAAGQPPPPGADSALMSFNHDTGRWEVAGTMTVSNDGMLVCTDPGVGIRAPGWHGAAAVAAAVEAVIRAITQAGTTAEELAKKDKEPGTKHPPLVLPCPIRCDKVKILLADPVYPFSGEFYLSAEDLRIPGRGPDFVWARKYRSKIGPNTAQGNGWDFSYNINLQLTTSGPDRVLRDGNSRSDTYRLQPDGSWTLEEFFRRLVENPDGTHTLEFEDADKWNFNALDSSPSAGKIASIVDHNGNRLSFGYDAQGRLNRITDTLGRNIDIGYNADGFISTVTDFSGRTVRYAYYDGIEPGGSFGDLKSVTTPLVVGTPNGNDFPDGKTTTYTYSTGYPDERLNHNLLTVTDPKGQTYLVNTYAATTNPQDVNFDRLLRQVWGHPTDIIDFIYTPLAPTSDNSMAVMQTIVNDRNGNVKELFYDDGNRLVIEREYTGRANPTQPTTRITNRPQSKLRTSDPPFFETRYQWNNDSLRTRVILPEGNTIDYVYEGDINPNAPARSRANLLKETMNADSGRGGDQAQTTTSLAYEPIYNQPRTQTEPRGNDPSYIPQNGGGNSPERYTVVHTFDYEESCDFQAIGDRIGRMAAQAQQLLDDAGMCNAPLGDVNGDGVTNQVVGNVIRVQYPSAHLLPGSNQAVIEGGTLQPVVRLYAYNQFSQLVSTTDPEGNVTLYEYHPENDPDGDGLDLTPGVGAGPFGYIKQVIRDAVSDPRRNSGTNPPPARIRRAYNYDAVGNIIREVDGRGIATDYVVNELNQVVQVVRAAAHGVFEPDPAEPRELPDFRYLERISYDANDNTQRRQIEDRGNTSNVGGDNLGSGTAFVDYQFEYDILNNLLEAREEVSDSEELVTLYRYDPNQNLVMTVLPEGNAVSATYDERDLLFQRVEGALTPPLLVHLFPGDPVDYDVRGGLPSTTTLHYGLNPNLVEIVDAADTDGSAANNSDRGGDGDRTRFIYDGLDRLTSVVDAVGNQTVFQFDPAANQVRELVFGPVGGPSPTADGPDKLLMPVSSNGVIQPANLVNKNLLQASETLYDELGRVFQADQLLFVNTTPTARPADVADGAADLGKGNLTPGDVHAIPGVTSATILGRVSRHAEYDRGSRMTFAVEDDGDTDRTFYDGVDRMIKTIGPEGNIVERAYDDNSNTIEVQETDVSQVPGVPNEVFLTTYFYDSLNRRLQEVDNLGQSMEYRYDSRHNLVAIADAQGPLAGASITRRSFPTGPSTVNQTNGPGNVRLYFYDGINRRVREEVVLTASGQGDGTNLGADIFGVKAATPAPDPAQGGGDGIIRTGYTYDRNSLASSGLDDQGNITLNLYDNQHRKIAETRGLTVGSIFSKAAVLGARQVITPTVATVNTPAFINEPKVNQQLADARARVDSIAALFPSRADRVDPPTTALFGFDQDSNLLILENENDSEVFTKYDAVNRPLAVRVFRSGQADSHVGDPRFAPAPVEDPSNSSSSLPAVVGTTRQDFEYDGVWRITRATDNNDPQDASDDSLTIRAYDSLDRVLEESRKIGLLPQRTVSTAWRGQNLISSLTYPNGRTIGFSYDGLDRLVSVADVGAAQAIAAYDYIGVDRIIQRAFPANSTRMTHLDDTGAIDVGYDGLPRPVQARHLRADGSLMVGFTYTYDRLNNKLTEDKLHSLGNSELYRYDSAYRLTQFDRGALSAGKDAIVTPSPEAPLHRQWTLDGVGNWLQVDGQTRQHSSFNEITSQDEGSVTVQVTSDDNGNETSNGVFAFEWDFQDRLRRVTRESDGALVATYAYDADGMRIRKVVTNSGDLNGTTDYYYHYYQIFEEYDGGHQLLQQYVYGVGLDEPVALDRNLDGDGNAIGAGDQRLFYHQNELGSTFALTDGAGRVVEGYHYEAYGQQTVFQPGPNGEVDFGGDDVVTRGGASAVGNPFLFTGRQLDPETGLLYYRHRYHDPAQGRFISRDPIGFWQDAYNLGNAYTYAASRPTGLTDALGLMPTKDMAMHALEYLRYVRKAEIALEKDYGRPPTPKETLDYLAKHKDNNPKVSPWAYIYTKKKGWIDMGHFLNAASWRHGWTIAATKCNLISGVLQVVGIDTSDILVDMGGLWIEFTQGLRMFDEGKPPPGTASSGWNWAGEDIPSNRAGIEFGKRLSSQRSLYDQLLAYFHEDLDYWHDPVDTVPGYAKLPQTERTGPDSWEAKYLREVRPAQLQEFRSYMQELGLTPEMCCKLENDFRRFTWFKLTGESWAGDMREGASIIKQSASP